MTVYSQPSMVFMIIDSLRRSNAAVALFKAALAGVAPVAVWMMWMLMAH